MRSVNAPISSQTRAMTLSQAPRTRLPEQARARIPGRIRAFEQPAKIGRERQQDEDRLAERAGEMRNRGVDRDDEIERGDDGRRVGKILEIFADLHDARMRAQHRRIVAPQIALQADELNLGIRQERREFASSGSSDCDR